MDIQWKQDGVDPSWFISDGVGSIRSSESYRGGGWWFLPAWMPDDRENDVGPFKTKAMALSEAQSLYAAKQGEAE